MVMNTIFSTRTPADAPGSSPSFPLQLLTYDFYAFFFFDISLFAFTNRFSGCLV